MSRERESMKGQPVRVRRALLSVWDKTGVVDLARGLVQMDVTVLSSGGTARILRDADISVTEVESVTGAPEILGGRVKTLHPRVHGGILAVRSNPEHIADLERLQIETIDLVVVNLYPFEETVADPDASVDKIFSMIDIGGPAMVRAAAKNVADVCVVIDPCRYQGLLHELENNDGHVSFETRLENAKAAFALTAAYDSGVSAWLTKDEALPEQLFLPLRRADRLRYGENPHQIGALYLDPFTDSWLHKMVQHGGKELSFNNLWDVEAAWRLVREFEETAAVVMKHAMPCGVAEAISLPEAYIAARACDELSAFGSVVALNAIVEEDTAVKLLETFIEAVVAPGYTAAARARLAEKPNLRVLEAPVAWSPQGFDMKRLSGGFVVQDFDSVSLEGWRVAGKKEPTLEQWADLNFAWQVTAHVRSNAIVLAKGRQAFGIGSGQQSRVDAADLATRKADGRAIGGVAASDAFFPFRDGLDACVAAGVKAVVAPSGSKRDDEVVAAADELDVALIHAPERHFRH